MPDLPTGTVTFLFTDLEGSTRLWEEHPAAMAAAIARHDALLRPAIEGQGGVVFKTVGDAFCAAFGGGPAALAAALAAQRALLAEAWSETGPLRVRMALYTGAAAQRDGDYFGQPLNRADRFLTAMHGGQILVSETTAALLRQTGLAADVALRDLGEHRFKGVPHPERVFQLVAPDLPADFPPLASLGGRFDNLPAETTALVGRDDEVSGAGAELVRDDVCLVTLTGPGGVGKTRLALRVARRFAPRFADGVCWVPLDAVVDPTLVMDAVLLALGVPEEAGQTPLRRVATALRDKQFLLVLDNFEHLLGAAPALADLLAATPRLTVLTTSRAELDIACEQEFPVAPLELPRRGPVATAAAVAGCEAVDLFVRRARAVKPGFVLDDENAPAVVEVCRRLDGLPLAIELAAARIKLLPPRAMATRLDRRLDFLAGGGGDLPARQRQMRGAIAWSYDLLDPDERALFRRLAVFPGGCGLAAAEAVGQAAGPLTRDLLSILAALIDESLVRQEETSDEPRLTMLQTIQEFGLEQLAASGETDATHAAHAAVYLALAEEARPRATGAARDGSLDHLETELDNLRAAHGWFVERGEAEGALRLAVALWPFWRERGQSGEGRSWLERALAAGAAPPPLVETARRLVAEAAPPASP